MVLLGYFLGITAAFVLGWVVHTLATQRRVGADTTPPPPPPSDSAPPPPGGGPTAAPVSMSPGAASSSGVDAPASSPRPVDPTPSRPADGVGPPVSPEPPEPPAVALAFSPGSAAASTPPAEVEAVDIGLTATNPELRTELPVELGLRRHADRWLLQVFSLDGATARLGEVPVQGSSLPITEAARELVLRAVGQEHRIDLSSYVTALSLRGGVELVDSVKGALPGIFAVRRAGLVLLVAVQLGQADERDLRRRMKTLDELLTAYPDVWVGDPDVTSAGLRQDILRVLGDSSTSPLDGSVGVLAAGPGSDGPVWSVAGRGLEVSADGDRLVARCAGFDPVRLRLRDDMPALESGGS